MCSCIQTKEVGPLTLFEQITEGKKFFNADMRCEYAGNQLVLRVDSGQTTVQEAVDDCVTFARKVKGKGHDGHMLGWLCMHLALGLCHKFDVQDKKYIRSIMEDILPYSRGIDQGLFYRDINAFGDEGQYLDRSEKDLLEKAMYYLKICSGFKVDLKKGDLGRQIYGALKATYPDEVRFIDLPIGNPAYALGTAAPKISSPLMMACENLKPYLILRLLRYGATAHGEPLNFILASLSHLKTLEAATGNVAVGNPAEVTKLCLNYLLRAVTHLKLVFDEEKIGDMQHESDVYYVARNVTHYLDKDYYATPNKLKQLCRVKIREILLENDQIPDGIYRLPSRFNTGHKRYLDLLA